MASVVLTLLLLLPVCVGYTHGPPMSVCQTMFPTGHYINARSDSPPFSLHVNATTYNPGDVIEVSLNSSGDWFYEGVFIQARVANCSKSNVNITFGEFRPMACDDFLTPRECNEQAATALAHYSHLHVYNKTFYWVAPAQTMGHFYFRGTIARKKTIFWTNVFSEYITDPTDNSTPERCPIISKYADALTGDANGVKYSAILFLSGLLMTFVG